MLHKDVGTENKLRDTLSQEMEINGSFPAGTRIITDKGLIPIEEIKIGDMVLSKPESGVGELAYKPVIRTVTYDDQEIWELTYFEIKANTDISKLHKGKLLQLSHKGNLISISATPNHRFWVKDVGWIRLKDLKNGQVIEVRETEKIALVLMVHPVRRTTAKNISASYAPRNIFDAEKKGFNINDIDWFTYLEYHNDGTREVLNTGDDHPSPLVLTGVDPIHVLKETFTKKTYNFEFVDYNTYFITRSGLWVRNIST